MMLDLRHFTHLPEMAEILDRIAAEDSGMVVVAGLDPRRTDEAGEGALLSPGGRAAIFRIIVRRMLPADTRRRVVIVTDAQDPLRVLRERRRQISVIHPDDRRAASIAGLRPALLVFERLDETNVASAVEAAAAGVHVVVQLDTVFRGAEVVRVLAEMGARPEALDHVRWIIATQRWPALCPECRKETTEPELRSALTRLYGTFEGPLFVAPGCEHCSGTGRQGDVAAFDAYGQFAPGRGESLMPLTRYLLGLALDGHLSARDLLDVEGEQLRRTYRLLTANERALNDANAALQRKLVEFEAAQRVLEQRNRALMSLEDISRALLSTVSLRDLASQICRNACELGGADRAILYCQCEPGIMDVLGASGWGRERLPDCVDASVILDLQSGPSPEARPYHQWPPGIAYRSPDVEGVELRAGLWVPLVAQDENVGALVVHSTRRSEFAPSEAAVLEAFAGQAALAVQRTRLIEQLQEKVSELEAAQAGLAAKERMERELELARQVQQSILPRTFPEMPGYGFAARNEPARRVGGDFYDVINLGDGHFGIVIADVSDKGMAAALYMALSRSLLLAEARRERSPAAVLKQVNRLLRELGEPGMFVSMFYGVTYGPGRHMRYARAGHDRPLLLRGGTVHELGGRGALLGTFEAEELHLTEEDIVLASGDRIVLFTDGLTDAISEAGEVYGLERLKQLAVTNAGLSPDPFCDALFGELHGYCGAAEQFDDMTLLVADVA